MPLENMIALEAAAALPNMRVTIGCMRARTGGLLILLLIIIPKSVM